MPWEWHGPPVPNPGLRKEIVFTPIIANHTLKGAFL